MLCYPGIVFYLILQFDFLCPFLMASFNKCLNEFILVIS